jgi:zinc protease
LHPAFPQTAFTPVRRQIAPDIAGQLQSPDYLFDRAIDRAILSKDDPSFRNDTPGMVNAVTPGDVRAYAASILRPDLTTIVVVGVIKPEAADKPIETHFVT